MLYDIKRRQWSLNKALCKTLISNNFCYGEGETHQRSDSSLGPRGSAAIRALPMPLAPFWVIDANISRPATRNFRGYPRYYPARGTASRIGSDLAVPSVSSSPPKVRLSGFAFNGHPRGLFCIAAADLNDDDDDDQRRKREGNRGETTKDSTAAKGRRRTRDSRRNPRLSEAIAECTGNNLPPSSSRSFSSSTTPVAAGRVETSLLASSLEALATAVGRASGPLGPFHRSRNFLLR